MRCPLAMMALLAVLAGAERSFVVRNNQFVKDGVPMQIISGSLHYSRVPAALWEDRLKRLSAMGLNAVQTYVPWNWHEEKEGVLDFTGDRDLVHFLKTAQSVGLLVLLRSGPYICGEWEWGGFPAWLMNKNVTIRTYEPNYIAEVDRFMTNLFTRVKPLLYSNGGPVVMVQVENEYGSYGDVSTNPSDKQYLEHLVSLAHTVLGNGSVILYTTDGGSTGYMQRGSLPGSQVLTLGDHGPGDFEESCKAQASFNPPGFNPCMDTELYTGWLTHWGETMANKSSAGLVDSVGVALGKGYSMNFYMAFGGTNFAQWAGANGGGKSYSPTITSYDYNSPISENGDHGYGSDGKDKFEALRAVIARHVKQPFPQEPPIPPRAGYGKIELTHRAEVEVSVLSGSPHRDTAPRPMEVYGEYYGLIKYSTKAARSGTTLEIEGYPRDRAQVFVNGKLQGTIYRPTAQPLKVSIQAGATVDILVEAMGRLNYGRGMMADNKGIATPVTLDGEPLGTAWEVYPIPLNYTRMQQLKYTENTGCAQRDGPAFYKGMLTVAGTPAETYVRTDGFGKGNVWVNGVNLGRYWEEMGPQHGLFVPSSFLREGENEIVVLEMDKVPAGCTASSVPNPDFSGKPLPPCTPPSPGAVLKMATCGLRGAQEWDKSFKLHSNNTLCLASGPTKDPTSGYPSATLAMCDGTSFVYDSGTKAIKNTKGECLDITGHLQSEGAPVEFYPCNGGTNQQWSLQDTPGHTTLVVTLQDGKCLTAC